MHIRFDSRWYDRLLCLSIHVWLRSPCRRRCLWDSVLLQATSNCCCCHPLKIFPDCLAAFFVRAWCWCYKRCLCRSRLQADGSRGIISAVGGRFDCIGTGGSVFHHKAIREHFPGKISRASLPLQLAIHVCGSLGEALRARLLVLRMIPIMR